MSSTNSRKKIRLLILLGCLSTVLVLFMLSRFIVFRAETTEPDTRGAVNTDPKVEPVFSSRLEERGDVNGKSLDTLRINDIWKTCLVGEVPTDNEGEFFSFFTDLELSSECLALLSTHVLSINPFTHHMMRKKIVGRVQVPNHGIEFSLVILDNPMTYERLFSDPDGDFARIEDALTRNECLTTNENLARNDLKEICHADAFTNVAALIEFCHDSFDAIDYVKQAVDQYHGVQTQQEMIDKTWKGFVERRWVAQQCRRINWVVDLDLSSDPRQFELLLAIGDPERIDPDDNRVDLDNLLRKQGLYERRERDVLYRTLLEVGARLGDDAAALTDEGLYKGRFSDLFASQSWRDLSSVQNPSESRLQLVVDFIVALEEDETDFDWEWLVTHICAPQEFRTITSAEISKPRSCRDVVNSLYNNLESTSEHQFEILKEFERVAIERDVYN